MEVEEEVENKEKLDEQRRRLQKQVRETEKFTDMDQMFRDSQKEKWKEMLLEIEEKRNELLPEHQRMQKRSQKMQSIQDRKRNLLEEAGACEEEMRKVRDEINEREARYLQQSNKSTNNRMAAEDLEEELRGLRCRQGRKEEVAVPRKPMPAASMRLRSRFSQWERRMRDSNSKLCRQN